MVYHFVKMPAFPLIPRHIICRTVICLGGALLAAACKKEATKPAPAFEGRWQGESVTILTYSKLGGQLTGQFVKTPAYRYMVVTKDSLLYYYPYTNRLVAVGDGYTRQGNTLTFDQYMATIRELSDSKLVIRYADYPTNIPYTETEESFSR